MSPDRLPDILSGITQKARLVGHTALQEARLVGLIAKEFLTHPFSRSLILIDNGGIRVVPDGLMKMGEPYRRRQQLLIKSALGAVAVGVMAGGVAVSNLWESRFTIDRAFMNGQQGQVATYEEFVDKKSKFLMTAEAEKILVSARNNNILPLMAAFIAGSLALGSAVGSRLVGPKLRGIPDSFWQLPQAQDPGGLVRKALLEEREHGR